MNNSAYIMAGGGAGDFIYHHFMNTDWRLLKPIKEKFPNVHITMVTATHVGNEYELTYMNPHIDTHLIYKWYAPGDSREYLWKEPLAGISVLDFAKKHNIHPTSEQPELFLSEVEKDLLSPFKNEKYITIHPFAGLPHRGCKRHPLTGEYMCLPDYKYIETATVLADIGYKVIFIGRTNTSYDKLRANDESLDIPVHENIFNFINVGSLRTNVYLVRNSIGFIGTHSSMLSAAWTNYVPSVFFYPGYNEHGEKRSVIDHGGETGTWALDKPIHSYFELRSEEFLSLKGTDIVNSLLKNISKK